MADFPPIRWSDDFYRRPFAPRRERLPVPDVGIFDDDTVCVQVNKKWVSHVIGVLEVLNQDDAWSGTDDEIYNARNEVQLLIEALMVGGCTNMIRDVRLTSTGILQKTYDGETWENVGDVNEQAVILAPTSSTRNKIKPTGNYTPLAVVSHENLDLFHVLNNPMGNQPVIDVFGRARIRKDLWFTGGASSTNYIFWSDTFTSISNNASRGFNFAASEEGVHSFSTNDSSVIVRFVTKFGRIYTVGGTVPLTFWSDLATKPAAVSLAASAQSADIHQYQHASGSVLSAVDKIGRWRSPVTVTTPTDTPGAGTIAVDSVDGGIWTYTTANGWLKIGQRGLQGADGASVELRQFGGVIQWRQSDNDPTWTNLVSLADITGAQGAQGIQGIPGQDGQDGRDGRDAADGGDQPTPDGMATDERVCGLAEYLTGYVKDVYSDHLTKIAGASSATSAVISISAGLFGGILLGAAVQAFVDYAIGVGTTLIQTENDLDFWENVKCSLYCILKRGSTLDFTTAIRDQWTGEITALNDVGGHFVKMVIDGITMSVLRQRAGYGAATTGFCLDCDACTSEHIECASIDLTSGTHGFRIKFGTDDPTWSATGYSEADTQGGSYLGGQGFVSTLQQQTFNTAQYAKIVTIIGEFAAPIMGDHRFTFTYECSGFDGDVAVHILDRRYESGVWTGGGGANPVVGNGTHSFYFDGNNVEAIAILLHTPATSVANDRKITIIGFECEDL